MEDRGDEMVDPEAAISDIWSWARANARTGAKALDPRLLGQLTTIDLR